MPVLASGQKLGTTNREDEVAATSERATSAGTMPLIPAVAGLDLICEGLRLISADDHAALERGKMVYDAIYSRLAVEHARESAQ